MNNIVEKEQYKGYTICIISDDDPMNPRTEFDNLGTIVTWHRRYNLGDNQPDIEPKEWLTENVNEIKCILPVYMYEHSGITISVSSFNDSWDSGQLGFIYVTKEKLKQQGLQDKTIDEIKAYLTGEIKMYDQYLTGNVYGYEIYYNDNCIDSCWGYFGNDHESHILPDARKVIDATIARHYKDHFHQLKQWIKNKVPLMYRKPAK